MPLKNLKQGAGQQANPLQLARQLQSNTGNMLEQAHVSVPQSLHGNPGGIIQHLLRTGQITQEKLLEAQKQAAQMTGRR